MESKVYFLSELIHVRFLKKKREKKEKKRKKELVVNEFRTRVPLRVAKLLVCTSHLSPRGHLGTHK